MNLKAPGCGVVVVCSLAVIVGCTGSEPSPVPTQAASSPPASSDGQPRYPMAQIAALTPLEVSGDFEADPAVQVYRDTGVVLAWANLTDSSEFAQITQYVHGDYVPGVVGFSDLALRYEWAPIGPAPSVVESVVYGPDGSATIQACERDALEVSKGDGSARQRGSTFIDAPMSWTVSPLSDVEVAELHELGLEAPLYRVRSYDRRSGTCDASAATVQQFVDWRDYAPIGHYNSVDTSQVAVLDEDGNLQYVDPDDLP